MPGTYSQLLVHVVTPTKGRTPWIGADIAERLYPAEAVKNYIARQAEHHRQEDFKSQLLRMFHAHDVEFDERYVFD